MSETRPTVMEAEFVRLLIEEWRIEASAGPIFRSAGVTWCADQLEEALAAALDAPIDEGRQGEPVIGALVDTDNGFCGAEIVEVDEDRFRLVQPPTRISLGWWERDRFTVRPAADGGGHDQPDDAVERVARALAAINQGEVYWSFWIPEAEAALRAAEGSSQAPTAAEVLAHANAGGELANPDGDVLPSLADLVRRGVVWWEDLTTPQPGLRLVSAPQGDDVGAEGEEGER